MHLFGQTTSLDHISQLTINYDFVNNSMLTPLSNYGFIRVHGEDAEKYLQGQITCNVEEITEQHSSLAACCNPQGQVQCIFRLFKNQNAFYLRLPNSLLDSTMQRLKKYAIFSKVKIEEANSDFIAIGFAGNSIEKYWLANISHLPSSLNETVNFSTGVIVKVSNKNARYEVYMSSDAAKNSLDSFATQLITTPSEFWHLLNIKEGIPEIYSQTYEMFTPHHLNLPQLNAVSFKKGCYTGQEIIARMEYRSTNKPKLFYFEVDSKLSPNLGASIYKQQQSVGTIVDFATAAVNNYHLLITIKEQEINQQPFYLDIDNTIEIQLRQNLLKE